jgi:uncharacterized RDD family membrane protein YckC
MTQVAPGWYADPAAPPHGAPALRWWDGFTWTAHVQPVRFPPAGPTAPFAPAGPTTVDGVPLASWGWRVLAYLLDTAILSVPNALVTLPAQLVLQRRLQDLNRDLELSSTTGRPPDLGAFFSDYLDLLRSQAVWLLLPGIVITTAYFAVLWRWRGASVGQQVTGLQVRPVGGPGRLSWPTVLIRAAVLALLPTLVMLLGLLSESWPVALVLFVAALAFQLLNQLWPLWDSRRQALHDKAARTVVVRPTPHP